MVETMESEWRSFRAPVRGGEETGPLCTCGLLEEFAARKERYWPTLGT
jgi:hypothetical protein